ncbi:MAG: c-type cytochrome biogenesis protein CcsB [Thermodesulfovibrionales bacterium]|nr:c-type cytochrome biogenesis protein CcsB [Thermodesulfovibrionales bacterium]
MNSAVFFGLSTMAYIFAMILYITYLAFRKQEVGILATTITIAGFISQTSAIFLRWGEFADLSGMGILKSAPLTNLYESLVFFVWCLILGYLIIEFKFKNRSFGAFVTPIASLMLAFIDLTGVSKEIQPLVPALKSNWLLAHVTMSFFAYATFALSCSTGLMYLILTSKKRNEGSYFFWTITFGISFVVLVAMGIDLLAFKVAVKPDVFIQSYLFKASFLNPSTTIKIISWVMAFTTGILIWRYGLLLNSIVRKFNVTVEMLDEITYKSIAIGFPVFTLGGLIFGAIWADQAWGVYWSWDPKETWSLITWFIYAFYLHGRLLKGWRGKKIAIVAVVGFVAVMFTYLGVNLLLSGLHAYGSG